MLVSVKLHDFDEQKKLPFKKARKQKKYLVEKATNDESKNIVYIFFHERTEVDSLRRASR